MNTNYFVFIYKPGPNWLPNKPITAQPLAGHFHYMSQLEAAAQLVVGGGFTDGSGAMGVIHMPNLAQAEALIANDPVVKDEIVTATVHPWYVTVAGTIEKS
ncbi:MAG: hypothetical protein GY942_08900 [Aestuariibacter sp.]|nr:hypothetical protein [Aestuariibacter sp.]